MKKSILSPSMSINKKHFISYLYIFLLLAFSGNPFFSFGGDNLYTQFIFVTLVVFLSVIHLDYFRLNNKEVLPFFWYIGLYILLFIIQVINLKFVSIQGAVGFILKITLGYIVARFLGEQLKLYYFNAIYFLSLISLIGFSLSLADFEFPNFLNESRETIKSMVVYTENKSDIKQGIRNSGMFWEPGAFAGYICLLFLLFLGQFKHLFRQNKFRLIIILTALITTFSTTGYLVFFLIVMITITKEYLKRHFILGSVLITSLIMIGFLIYSNTSFLSEKITYQYETLQDLSGDYSSTRFGALAFDMHYIKKNPITGNGMHESTRYIDHPWLQKEHLGHGNGFSNFIASMGFFGIAIFMVYLVRYKTKYRWIFLLCIIALLQGEQYLNFPLFLSLPFFFIHENRNTSYLPQQKR